MRPVHRRHYCCCPAQRKVPARFQRSTMRTCRNDAITSHTALTLPTAPIKCPFLVCAFVLVVLVCGCTPSNCFVFLLFFVLFVCFVVVDTLTAFDGCASFRQCCLLQATSLKRARNSQLQHVIQRVEQPGKSQEASDGKKCFEQTSSASCWLYWIVYWSNSTACFNSSSTFFWAPPAVCPRRQERPPTN